MEETAARRAAEALVAEHKAGTQFKALAGLASMGDAYDIQDKYVPLLRAAHGEPVGYKVGLTSKAMQTFCGVDHPIAGVVLAKPRASVRRQRAPRRLWPDRPRIRDRGAHEVGHAGEREHARGRRSPMSTASQRRSRSSTTAPPITAIST